MCLGILKMCRDSGDSQAELAKMPLDNHKQCFDTAAEVLRFYGSMGTKVLGTQPLIQKNPIVRWKFLNNVVMILEQGSFAQMKLSWREG